MLEMEYSHPHFPLHSPSKYQMPTKGEDICSLKGPLNKWVCTRLKYHTGPHEAGFSTGAFTKKDGSRAAWYTNSEEI